jgi:excisionase family DNA binding protein
MKTSPEVSAMERLLSNDEAAEILGISPFSLRGKILRREVPHIKIGRRTLFSPKSLQEYIEAQKVAVRPRREAQ